LRGARPALRGAPAWLISVVVGNETTRAVPDGATSAAAQDLTNLLDVARGHVGTVKHDGKAVPIAAQAIRAVTRAVSAHATIAVAAAVKVQLAGIDPVPAVNMATVPVRTAPMVLVVSTPIGRARTVVPLAAPAREAKAISLAVSTVTVPVRIAVMVLVVSTPIVRVKTVAVPVGPRVSSPAANSVTARVRTVVAPVAPSGAGRDSSRAATGKIASANGSMGPTEALVSLR